MGDHNRGRQRTVGVRARFGEEFSIRDEVTQGTSTAKGTNTFTACHGSVQDWSVLTTLVSGPPFSDGPATTCARATSRPTGAGAIHDQEEDCILTLILESGDGDG